MKGADHDLTDGRIDAGSDGEEALEAKDGDFGLDRGDSRLSVKELESQYPEIKNFGNCDYITEEEIRQSLDTLPESHREHVISKVERISYVDEERFDENGDRIYGRTYHPEGKDKVCIEIYKHDNKKSAELTLNHEYAHIEYPTLSPEQQEGYYRLYKRGGLDEEISPEINKAYPEDARPEEDFCESYAHYRVTPERLARKSPYKYNFMKYQVFEGKGYMHPVDESRLLHGTRRVEENE